MKPLLFALIGLLLVSAPAALRAETYGNFNTMGVLVDCPKGYTPRDIGRIRAYLSENGERRPVHDFVQVASAVEPRDYFATSLFSLQPDTKYTVEVEYYDLHGRLVSTHRETGRTRAEPKLPETARALFVSPAGSDANPGTLERPLKSIGAAFAAARPGTTIYLRAGAYYEGDLTAPRGGAKSAPIVVRNYQGERAIIDGSYPELAHARWTPEGDGIYASPIREMTWNVTLEETATGKHYRCYPLRTMKELTSGVSAGKTFEQLGFTGAYHFDGKLLHLRLPKGAIEDYRVHAATPRSGVVAQGCSHLFFDGIEFRYIGDCAAKLLDTSETVFQNCRVLYANAGIWVKGDSSNNTIQDSVFTDDVSHWDFGYAKTELGWLYHGYVETGAVCVDGRYSGRGLVVRRNRIENLFDGSHLCPWVTINVRSSETDFYDNDIKNIADDFIETDGFSRNVRIFGNHMDGALTGISIAQALDGPTWIVRNVIANWGMSTSARLSGDWGYPIKTNGGDHNDDMGTGPVFLYHNTSYTGYGESRAFLVKYAIWRNLRFRNNIWCGKIGGIFDFERKFWPVNWDYDDIYHESGPFAEMGGVIYETLGDFRKGRVTTLVPDFGDTKIGTHLISLDPKLADISGGDCRLRSDSPCIDAGEVLPGINDRQYTGKAPDMGAFEYGE